jgi:hypothetical protein
MMGHPRGTWSIVVSRAARAGVFVVLATLLSFSCGSGSIRRTIPWLPDRDGFVQYSTNALICFDTIQHLPLADEEETPMTTVTATAAKMSGAGLVGFGIVLCYQDGNNHYILLITAGGDYRVAKNVGGMAGPCIILSEGRARRNSSPAVSVGCDAF